ncbi:MAG: DUF7107 domain-containing protein [Thermomicrobiales bacterium]
MTGTSCTAAPGAGVVCAEATCANGWQTTYGCGGNSSCHPTTTSCGLYVCNAAATACLESCTTDSECIGDAFCLNGACVEDRLLGEDCTADAQCQSGICAQGVCCASACPGPCQACNVAGNLGFCTEIPDDDPCAGGTCCDGECVDSQSNLEHRGACDHACDLMPNGPCEQDPICQAGVCTFTPQPGPNIVLCRDSAGICDTPEYCDGVTIACPDDAFQPSTFECRAKTGVCDVAEFCTGSAALCPEDRFAGSETVCRPASCTGGVETQAAFCTGMSASCPDAVTESCSPYLCGTTACLDTCPGPDNEGCIASHHCDAGECLLDEGLGEPCDEDSDCISGICNPVNLVCCTAVCASGVACTGPGATCCEPDCTGRECGDDGCGGTRGACDANQCLTRGSGQTCESTCGSGQICVGGTCQDTCPPGADVCIGELEFCAGLCACFATVSGASFRGGGGDCFARGSDADCVAETGPGSACIIAGGDNCNPCTETGGRGCVAPCPLSIPTVS